MINAVSGLPAIVVDTFEELKAELDKNSTTETLRREDSSVVRKKRENTEQLDKSQNNNQQHIDRMQETPRYEQLAANLKEMLNENDMTLEFSLDKDTNEMILKIIDSDTLEVIRQLPPELTLKIAKFVADMLGTGQVTNARV